MPEIIPLSCSNWDGSSYCDYSAQLIQQKREEFAFLPFSIFLPSWLLLFTLNFCPGIFQLNCPIKNKFFRCCIRIYIEVAQPLKLEVIQSFGIFNKWLDVAFG